MAITIPLEYVSRRRETMVFNTELARRLIRENRREELWEAFKNAVEETPLHEYVFVLQIVNFVEDPTKPPPPIDLMLWGSLLLKAGKMDETSKEWILDVDEQELVWKRITSEKFRFMGSPMDYMPFYMKLHDALARKD
jgi:hypothetical protein